MIGVRVSVAALLLAGCQVVDETEALPALDEEAFRCEVQPVLAARCSFYACHGDAQRPFRVYARNRLRLNPETLPSGYVLSAPLTADEEQANYEMALGFARNDGAGPLLLLKPLDGDVGGLFHGGKTVYGGADVFSTASDHGYQILERWTEGGTSFAGCTPLEDVGR